MIIGARDSSMPHIDTVTTLLPIRPAIMRHLMCAITSTQSLVSARMGRNEKRLSHKFNPPAKLIWINFEICNRFAFSFSSALVSRSIKRIRITDSDQKIYVTAPGFTDSRSGCKVLCHRLLRSQTNEDVLHDVSSRNTKLVIVFRKYYMASASDYGNATSHVNKNNCTTFRKARKAMRTQ